MTRRVARVALAVLLLAGLAAVVQAQDAILIRNGTIVPHGVKSRLPKRLSPPAEG